MGYGHLEGHSGDNCLTQGNRNVSVSKVIS